MSGFMYSIEQGDCLSSLAARYSLPSFRAIYDHPRNADFRVLRPNPNVIFPGDQVFIPAAREKTLPAATDLRHVYRAKIARTKIRIRLEDIVGRPMGNRSYTLILGSRSVQGASAANGLIEVEIDPLEISGLLVIQPANGHAGDSPLVWPLLLGHLDPVHTITGIQARLNNLCYFSGAIDGIIGPVTTGAVMAFQQAHNLVVDGIPGPKTQAMLKGVYGC